MSEKNDNPTEEELEQRAQEIADDLGYYAVFRVGLPSSLDEIATDEARADVSKEVLAALERMSKKYTGLTLDYNFGYQLRNHIQIPLIEE